uniref:A20-type domain-containing protein n=1 Tax=Monopterus albus TaxID=43700 RepID=A0A3Q3R428_MONAL
MGDTSERSKPPSLPPRCPCGFWGSSKTMNLCSKCFADIQKKQPGEDCTSKPIQSTGSSQSPVFSSETSSSSSQSLLSSPPSSSEQPSPEEPSPTFPSMREVVEYRGKWRRTNTGAEAHAATCLLALVELKTTSAVWPYRWGCVLTRIWCVVHRNSPRYTLHTHKTSTRISLRLRERGDTRETATDRREGGEQRGILQDAQAEEPPALLSLPNQTRAGAAGTGLLSLWLCILHAAPSTRAA